MNEFNSQKSLCLPNNYLIQISTDWRVFLFHASITKTDSQRDKSTGPLGLAINAFHCILIGHGINITLNQILFHWWMVMQVTENKAVTFDAMRQFTCVFAPVHTCDNSPASTSFSFSNDDTWELKSSIFKTTSVICN